MIMMEQNGLLGVPPKYDAPGRTRGSCFLVIIHSCFSGTLEPDSDTLMKTNGQSMGEVGSAKFSEENGNGLASETNKSNTSRWTRLFYG